MSQRTLTVLLGMLWLLTLTLYAHEGKVHVMGTVVESDAHHVVVKDQAGKSHSLLFTKDTKYWRGKTAATAADLKVGERIMVDAVGEGAKAAASEIRLGDMPTGHTEMDHGAAKPKP